jgi:NAD(P)H-dependent FMN reductase
MSTPHIVILSGSVRTGRKSHRVSLYFSNYIKENNSGSCEILDLQGYNFPIFDERLKFQKNPTPQMLDFADKIKKADGIILVTPEYNGGYPASVKNVIDLLYDEWHRKPIAITTVSGGDFAGTQVITSLQFSLWKIRARVVTAMFPVPKVQDNYDESGNPKDKAGTDKRASGFVNELLLAIRQNEIQ